MDGGAAREGLLRPLHTMSVGERLADRLLTALALGEFSPGERLPPERELAARLGVSRTAVRDALHRVAEAGLLDIRRGRNGGAYVLGGAVDPAVVRRTLAPDWPEVKALSDYRRLVEGLIARTAAVRRRTADVRGMRAALRAYEQADTMSAAREADAALHAAVAQAARNEHLVALSRQLLGRLSLGLFAEPFTQRIYDRALPGHRAIVAAVGDGDPEAAFTAAADHFAITTDALQATLAGVRRGMGAGQARRRR